MSDDMSRRQLVGAALACAMGLLPGAARAAPTARIAPRLTKKVFAHYMVCCPAAGGGATVEDYKSEIRQAQAAGVDGFALNCGGWNQDGDYYKGRCEHIYEAAKQLGTGFLLFVSMDYCCINGLEATRDAMLTFRDHPNQFKVGGRAVLSTYGGEYRNNPKAGQAKIALVHSLGGFFVPFFFTRDYSGFNPTNVAELVSDYAETDGYFLFGAGSTPEQLISANTLLCGAWRGAGKVYMAGLSPYYRSTGRLFETHGFLGMAQEWEAAIRDGADWIEITTWNNWQEKTYVASFGPSAETKIWDGGNDGYGRINYSHVAYLTASRYYIDWFKTGHPPKMVEDRLFYFYRTEPKSATGKQFFPNEMKAGMKSISGVETLKHSVFATCFLTRPALLTIHSGDTVATFVMPAGVHHVSTPFALGTQRFTLSRSGHVLKDKTGEHMITDRQGETRYNYFAGEA
jgi:glucan endo-1,3-alpha-glucosidase